MRVERPTDWKPHGYVQLNPKPLLNPSVFPAEKLSPLLTCCAREQGRTLRVCLTSQIHCSTLNHRPLPAMYSSVAAPAAIGEPPLKTYETIKAFVWIIKKAVVLPQLFLYDERAFYSSTMVQMLTRFQSGSENMSPTPCPSAVMRRSLILCRFINTSFTASARWRAMRSFTSLLPSGEA